jgi:beta-ureidopropionase / N-carbamoyl-L-amino-acid hydrolase
MNIDRNRLLARLDELGRVGTSHGSGRTRLALTEEDRLARDLVATWMREAGAQVCIDSIGNIHGVLRGADDGPPVVTGSHIDTVKRAGALDGCYGVVAGVEVIAAFHSAGTIPAKTLVVTAFTNEEGVRYAPDLLGSRVMTKDIGVAEALQLTSTDGERCGEELRRIGYAGDHAPWDFLPGVFVELHIEQGPILDTRRIPIGVVEGVQGYSWWKISVSGRANHAGTAPMSMRLDAGAAAMQIASQLTERSIVDQSPSVATIGTFSVEPGAINVVPGKATFTVDFRDPSDEGLARAEVALRRSLDKLKDAGFITTMECISRNSAVTFNDGICEEIAEVAAERSLPILRMVSGASHDAQMLARICPTAMIFVPSRGGISHNPEEFTEPVDLVNGAEVLLGTISRLMMRVPSNQSRSSTRQ